MNIYLTAKLVRIALMVVYPVYLTIFCLNAKTNSTVANVDSVIIDETSIVGLTVKHVVLYLRISFALTR